MPSTKGRPYIVITAERGCSKCKRGAIYDVEGPDSEPLGLGYRDRGDAAHIANMLTFAYRAGQHAQKADDRQKLQAAITSTATGRHSGSK